MVPGKSNFGRHTFVLVENDTEIDLGSKKNYFSAHLYHIYFRFFQINLSIREACNEQIGRYFAVILIHY